MDIYLYTLRELEKNIQMHKIFKKNLILINIVKPPLCQEKIFFKIMSMKISETKAESGEQIF